MLYDKNKAAGFFLGLSEDGLNFAAEIKLNYRADYQDVPMIGVYIVVELGNDSEALLGRITAVSSSGRLASSAGEEIGARSVSQRRSMPEDIKEQFLRYQCAVKLLGLLRENAEGKILFTASHRRLPHMGAKVMFAEDKVLQAAAGANREGEPIGFLAFGEFIYAAGHRDAHRFQPNFKIIPPIVEPRFDARAMVSRRTAVLARSGFGKSNLLKLLFTRLYEHGSPSIPDVHGNEIPVGTLVFDPDGDYFWPGPKADAPPGLCDIPRLQDRIVLTTDRSVPSPFYGSFKVSGSKVDLRELSPRLVISCALIGDRKQHRGSEAIERMNQADWAQLVDAAWIENQGTIGALSIPLISQLCRITNEASAGGVRGTMLDLASKIHDPVSTLVSAVEQGLRAGKIVIVDLSLMRGQSATIIAAMLTRYIFDHNVHEHTKANGRPLAVISLIEEAQKVLESGDISHAPFIDWVKEGRKYGLGSVLVTQQPGAIDEEILSQTDNFFVFHLVSGRDLNALKQANGNFADDILATLLNEPIEGQGVFWSSTGEQKTPYPIPFRAFDFGALFQRRPPTEVGAPVECYASRLAATLVPGPEPRLPVVAPEAGRTFPNLNDIGNPARELKRKLDADGAMQANFNKQAFPLFLLHNWLRTQGKKIKLEKLAIELVTLQWGLYGYGWSLENRVSQTSGKSYAAVNKLDPDEGLRRLQAGDDPLLPEPAPAVEEVEPENPE
jgi:hypothetical protein